MIKYRPGVDGLRTLAVIPVILFHADFSLFGGGYVGVDVFFVISGFLITSLLKSDIDGGRYSIVRFYERRIRRIFPALFSVMAVCLVVGWFVFLPDDFLRLTASASTAAMFYSNLLFYHNKSDYFDTPIIEKPLLHTWSLSVEEQFYIIFPVFLFLASRYFKKHLTLLIAVIFAFSLCASIVLVRVSPEAAFYLAPPRAWELLLGALIALDAFPRPKGAAVASGAAILGVALIGCSVFLYTAQTPFPGLAALAPCVGAGLVIWSGEGGDRTVFLDRAPIVYIGRISYSLYMWHFPILAFSKYLRLGEVSFLQSVGLLAVIFLVSVLSYRFIESPFRRGSAPGARRFVFIAGAVVILVAGGVNAASEMSQGFPGRIGRTQLAKYQGETPDSPNITCSITASDVQAGHWCDIGDVAKTKASFAVWGDSHAGALLPALEAASTATGRRGIFASKGACAPLPGIRYATPVKQRQCSEFVDAELAYVLSQPSIRAVVIVARWGFWANSLSYGASSTQPEFTLNDDSTAIGDEVSGEAFDRSMKATVETLIAAGKKVWLIGPVPEIQFSVPKALFLQDIGISTDIDVRPRKSMFLERQRWVFKDFDDLKRQYGVSVAYPDKALCNPTECNVKAGDWSLYKDNNHLSPFGASYMTPTIEAMFRSADFD